MTHRSETPAKQSRSIASMAAGKRAELSQVGSIVRPAIAMEDFGGYAKELEEGLDVRIALAVLDVWPN